MKHGAGSSFNRGVAVRCTEHLASLDGTLKCGMCGQSNGDIDKDKLTDLGVEERIRWLKTKKLPCGEIVDEGEECQPCGMYRRNSLSLMPQAAVIKLKIESPEFADVCALSRKRYVNHATGKRSYDKVDVQKYTTEQKQTDYVDISEDFTFYKLQKFCDITFGDWLARDHHTQKAAVEAGHQIS